MYRYHLATLAHWFDQKKRKPLVLRGARQVGKSTLVRLFAEQHKLELVELNLERNPEHAKIFDSNQPQQIVSTLRLLLNQQIRPGHCLLFLDEIQATPELLACLRYFYEEMPELHLIAAGSLLDFTLAAPTFSMPVGRISYLHLYPLNFIEFLHAMGEQGLADYLMAWQVGDTIPDPLHQKLMGLLRQNMLVGGMPEAVQMLIDSGDYQQCEQVKQDLLATFADDFSKYTRQQDRDLIRQIFRKAPTLLGQKVKFSAITRDLPAARVGNALDHLHLARLLHKVVRSAANGLPLSAEQNEKFFKLLFLDIGLVTSMLHSGWQLLQDDLMLINQGVLAEQWVGQELLSSLGGNLPPHMHYWAREARSSSAELDYVIEAHQVIPIEVKAGKSGSLKSLHLFLQQKPSDLAIRLNTDQPSLLHDEHQLENDKPKAYRLLSLPLYMAGQVRRLVGEDR